MIPSFNYKTPETLVEACDLLWAYGGRAKIIAGGTDLVIGLRNGDHQPQCLIDITKIEELRRIGERDGTVSIGAAVTHSEIVSSPLIKKYGNVLSDAASEIGSPQIRNLGTIGGNIVNASPAAATLPPLLVLAATGKVASQEGEREVPVAQLIKGPYETTLQPHEILVTITFKKLPKNMKGCFVRLARREAMAIARMSVALLIQMQEGQVKDIRIAPGAVLPTPQRLEEVEEFLKGRFPDVELLRVASRKVSETMISRSGRRPSTSYKAPVVEALFVRAMRME